MSPANARTYAQKLLASLHCAQHRLPPGGHEHPADRWAASGMMTLTGKDRPRMCPAPLAACADGVLLALQALAPDSGIAQFSGARLLAERLHTHELERAGTVSAGGSCQLLETTDGMLAVNLARADDWELLPAWLQNDAVTNWDNLAATLKHESTLGLLERSRMMGLPVSAVQPPRRQAVPWYRVAVDSGQRVTPSKRLPKVLDMTSLWAGPLCSRLLLSMGADVTKVESRQRPDGARNGPAAFFERMNAGKHEVSLDLHCEHGVEQLRALIADADIVIEAARPRALRQLGIDAEALVRQQPDLTWLSISGYGREQPQADWVAFGDDAGVAAGLTSLMFTATGEHLFCGDAIGDPLTGLHAALAAWAGYLQGGGRLFSLPMCDVVTHCAQYDLPQSPAAIRARQRQWTARAQHIQEAA